MVEQYVTSAPVVVSADRHSFVTPRVVVTDYTTLSDAALSSRFRTGPYEGLVVHRMRDSNPSQTSFGGSLTQPTLSDMFQDFG